MKMLRLLGFILVSLSPAAAQVTLPAQVNVDSAQNLKELPSVMSPKLLQTTLRLP